jgi:hypothetical protein
MNETNKASGADVLPIYKRMINAFSSIVTMRTSDEMFDADVLPRDAVLSEVQKAIAAHSDLRTAVSALIAERDAAREWRRDVCERLGFDCAAGVEWPSDHIWKSVTQEHIAIVAERDALAAEVAAMRDDAERWKAAAALYDTSKTIDAVMVLQGLGLPNTPYMSFAENIDAARTASAASAQQ